MKKILCLLLVVVMLVVSCGTLTGCAKKDSEIRIYLGDQIYDFDPALAFVDDNVSRIMSLIFEPLFLLDEDGSISYGLAEDYKIIEDETRGVYQMEITLRETFWNDGKTLVTADDIYFAWTRILDPEFPSQAAPLLYDVKNAVAVKKDVPGISRNDLGLEANKDTLTITFEGKIDYDAFLRNLTSVALSPLRENKVTEGDPDEEYWAKRPAYMATNGAFAIRSWNRATGEFALQRNEYYHISQKSVQKGNKSSVVLPSRLMMDWTDDNFEMDYKGDINAFLKTKNDNFYGNLEKLAETAIFCVGELPADKATRTLYLDEALVYDALSTYTYIFNTNKEPFNDANVRRALSMVIDREYLASELVFAKPADGLISPAVWDSDSKDKSFREAAGSRISTKADFEAAEKLVANVDKSETIVLTIRNTASELFIAEYVAEQWGELGFDVEINAVTMDKEIWATEDDGGRVVEVGSEVTVYDDGIQAAYYTGEFDVLGLDYNMYSTNAFTALCGFTSTLNGNGVEYSFDAKTGVSVSANRLHCSGYSDAEFDRIMQRALNEKNIYKKTGTLHAAEAYLLYTMPVMPIVYNQNYYLVSEIKGLEFDGYGNPVFTKAKLTVSMPLASTAAESGDDKKK